MIKMSVTGLLARALHRFGRPLPSESQSTLSNGRDYSPLLVKRVSVAELRRNQKGRRGASGRIILSILLIIVEMF